MEWQVGDMGSALGRRRVLGWGDSDRWDDGETIDVLGWEVQIGGVMEGRLLRWAIWQRALGREEDGWIEEDRVWTWRSGGCE